MIWNCCTDASPVGLEGAYAACRHGKDNPSNCQAGSVFVRVVSRRSPDLVGSEASSSQEFRGLPLQGTVIEHAGKTTPDQVSGVLRPVAVVRVKSHRNRFPIEAMRRKFGADAQRSLAIVCSRAHQLFGESVVALPTFRRHPLDRRLCFLLLNPTCGQLARKLLA